MQHYATPYSQCRRHGRHDRNADNTGGTRRSEFYASRTMQWRQKLFEHLVGFQMSTNPKQHYAMPLCNIHNVADMEGTIAMQITPEARGAPSSTAHSQWRQKLIIGESFDDRDDRHARETFPYSDLKGKEQVLEYICTYFDFPEYAMLPVPQANSHRH